MPRTIKTTVKTKPKIASNVLPADKSPKPTNVASLLTMIPAFRKPINVMNKPIPAPTAYYNSAGMASMMVSRTPLNERTIKMSPENNTPVNAVCQGIP